ncbi:short-chain dehydrogenase [uncultured Lutibacter sp.]|uniref:YqaA family protein n=1 Tax=uncultured Lutibacter sp. TaxID=437739 RepID=UPI002624372A|nr:short-chain dehydrogenase [uncultured Lutibacter sp.]
MKNKTKTQKKSKIELLHQYYSYTGFYAFIGKSLKKALWPVVIVIIALLLFNNYVYNVNEGLKHFTDTFTDIQVFTVFFLSESFLGLIPPEIFIAWSKKTSEPIFNLVLLAFISYVGGVISFFIGKAILTIEKVKNYFETKMSKHLKNTKKWGGFLIVVGALLPVPFSITCLAAGMIKYPIKGVLLFGLLRFARFAIYAAAIFQVVS